ncbi:hypothetical protein IAG25_38720 [Caballeronia sp. EK]|uniref:hypothetical protein n=1 Tax=Caballeronia sp. EK TaxID=2767469 RepID=UPI0016550F4F|nr:hypothetical protein [Caballeronia sp. EK]MBC8642737.1 hypothetical protein [Caballeronia sp. EK]
MLDVLQETWGDFTVGILTFPVLELQTRTSSPDGYVAIVRIDRAGKVLADWHLARSSRPFESASEAQRNALEYAIISIGRGIFDETSRKA